MCKEKVAAEDCKFSYEFLTTENGTGDIARTVDQYLENHMREITVLYTNSQRTTIAAAELHQLKYTCHQIHNETKGTVLHCNELVFDLSQLTTFFETCPASQSDHLCTVTLFQSQDYWQQKFCDEPSSLERFCVLHPTVTVNLRHSWLDPAAREFFLRANEFAVNLRKNTSLAYQIDVGNARKLIDNARAVWTSMGDPYHE